MKKIVITGGTSRFSIALRKIKTKHKLFFPTKKEFDITKVHTIKSYLTKTKPNIVIHLAGLSRPMKIHDENIVKSIDLNIVGTANVTKCCYENNTKLIYFSTNYVYPGIKGNYSEKNPLLPVNNYAWSKLGGEASVQLYKNSLILRICMTEKPFVHKKAFNDVEMNFMFHEDLAQNLLKLIDQKGIINVGGKKQKVIKFARKYNRKISPISARKTIDKNYPLNQSMNIDKYKNIIKKNKKIW